MTTDFWESFATKHRPQTTRWARVLSHQKITKEEFVHRLTKEVSSRMSPNKAGQIYDFLKKFGQLAYPD